MDDLKEQKENWYWRYDDKEWVPFPSGISQRIDSAERNSKISIERNEINEYSYQIIKTSANCAWQRNTFTNNVRAIIRNVDDIKDETEVLNQKNAHNPFAATKNVQNKYLGHDYQRFGEIFPGDSYVGGEYKWLHCKYMDNAQIIY